MRNQKTNVRLTGAQISSTVIENMQIAYKDVFTSHQSQQCDSNATASPLNFKPFQIVNAEDLQADKKL